MLLKIDPETNIHKNNRKRVERAIDSYKNTGVIPGKVKTDKLLYDAIFIGLTTDRDYLYERINKRVDVMMSNGLLNEAKWVYESNIRTKAVLTPIGYKELFPYFEGEKSLDECLDLIKQNSRRYAKRQYTWFNNQMNVNWFDVDFDNFNNTVENVLNYIKKESI
jgi:tRNA dimethylallyltransferase